MIAIIRIVGQVKIRKDIIETFKRMNMKKKYSCIVLDKPSKEILGMLDAVRNFVAYGEIDKEIYKKLVEKRGKQGTKFFRLHPPRGGIDSAKPFGVKKGVLGNHGDKINLLLERML